MSNNFQGFRGKSQRGFSLIELMVVLGVATILLAMAAPSFGSLIQRERMTSTVNDFLAALSLTRSEAIQRGGRVDLVPDEGGWASGWVVFVDGNDNQKPDAGENVIFRHGPVPAGMTVQAVFPYDSETEYVAYTGSGRTRKNGSSAQPLFGSFRFRTDNQRRNVVINMLGRPSVCIPVSGEESC